MKQLRNIEDRKVFPINIKYRGKCYLTLYYYTRRSDAVLHTADKHILCFRSVEDMELFCQRNDLLLYNEIAEYDFDLPIDNPIYYDWVLNNWNILNTIANTFGMFFEGNSKKYNSLYELLFRLNTPVERVEPTYLMSEKYYNYILKVFRKKDRFLNRFQLNSEE